MVDGKKIKPPEAYILEEAHQQSSPPVAFLMAGALREASGALWLPWMLLLQAHLHRRWQLKVSASPSRRVS
eukprot:Skav213744  [mRNA]  locus=scaffold19:170332:172206:- [translate_table: standard]